MIKTAPLPLALGALLLAAATLAHADATPSAVTDKGRWSYESSATAKVTYDDNIYLANVGTLAHKADTITSVGLNWQATRKFEDGKFSFSYAPTFNHFAHYGESEDYTNHLLSVDSSFKRWGFDWKNKASITYVNGNERGPLYQDDSFTGYSPALGIQPVVARRDQINYTANVNAERKEGNWLLEGVAGIVYNDYRTEGSTVGGYYNLVDRYTARGGFNIGYKIMEKAYLLGGYRLGYQWGGLRPGSSLNYTSVFNQFLIGARGNIRDDLKVDLLVGADLREFTGPTAAAVDTTAPYWTYEGSFTYTPTKSDTITGKFTRAISISTGGANAYEDSISSLNYTRKLTSTVSAGAGLGVTQRLYLTGSSTRDETLYTPSLSLAYTPKGKISYRANVAYESVQSDDIAGFRQQYDRSVYSVEANYKF